MENATSACYSMEVVDPETARRLQLELELDIIYSFTWTK